MKLASTVSRSLSEEEIKILKDLSSKLSDHSRLIASFVSSIKNSDVTRLIASGEVMKKLTLLDGAVDKAKNMEDLNKLLVSEEPKDERPIPSSAVAKLKGPVNNLVKDIKEQAKIEPNLRGGQLMRDIIKEALNDSALPGSPAPDSAMTPPQEQEDNSLVAILNMVNLGQFIDAMIGQGKINIVAVLSDLNSRLAAASGSPEEEAALGLDLRVKAADVQQASSDSAQAIEDMKKQINVVLQSLKGFIDFAKTNSPSQPLQSLQTTIDTLISGINEGIKDVDANS